MSLCVAFFLRHDVVFVRCVAQSEGSKQTRMKHEKRGRNLEFVWCLCTKCCEKQSVTRKLCRVACRTVLCAAKLFSLPLGCAMFWQCFGKRTVHHSTFGCLPMLLKKMTGISLPELFLLVLFRVVAQTV